MEPITWLRWREPSTGHRDFLLFYKDHCDIKGYLIKTTGHGPEGLTFLYPRKVEPSVPCPGHKDQVFPGKIKEETP